MSEPQPQSLLQATEKQSVLRAFARSGWLNLALLLATAASVFCVFFFFWESPSAPDRVTRSAVFTVAVLLILGSHEMGHWAMARAHGVESSLPYFLPIPLGFGTLGAVIRLRGRVPSRDALVDIGAAGPLAGLLVATPLLLSGVALSSVVEVPLPTSSWALPRMALLSMLRETWLSLSGAGGPAPWDDVPFSLGDDVLTWLAQRALVGSLPPGKELLAHPLFIAAWFGLVVTMLNLLPVGQLDGGHLTYAWFGAHARRVGQVFAGGLLVLSLVCSVSWLVWFVVVTRVVGVGHPPVLDEAVPLSRGRKVVCAVCFVMTALTFMPVPMSIG